MIKIESKNLLILSFNLNLIAKAMKDKRTFAEILEVTIPESWPVFPEMLPGFYKKFQADNNIEGWLNYLVIHKNEKTIIGDCGFSGKPDNNKTVEIGYSIIPAYRRQGYATEMVYALINWAFSTQKVDRVIACTGKTNKPSIKVLENLGFSLIKEFIKEDKNIEGLWQLYNYT